MSGTSHSRERDDSLINAAAKQFEALQSRRPSFPHVARPSSMDLRDASSVAAGAVGESLSGYDVLRERHRGGQGVVYEALQRGTKRKVAIKVLYDTPGPASTSRRRFEREIEVLSHLRHPNVVTIHDSGESGGRFYYVMDLVVGMPLDRWVEMQRRQRVAAAVRSGSRSGLRDEVTDILRVFLRICDAVNAAHLRGVIHRDLKPGNILVDEAGEPRVLDFGLAKFSEASPGEADPSMTQTGQFVGSLPWSSPEQAAGAPGEIDTRTDVYALGVLLYHALAGQFPYRVLGPLPDVIHEIRFAEPRPVNDARREPSLPGGAGGVSAAVSDELETIVFKCLQKDRQRRYQTAGDLGRDIQRFLDNEPIEAKRDSFGYVLRKQVRRHRVAVLASGGVLAAIVLGLCFSLYFWRSAERRRGEVQVERDRAVAAERDSARRMEEADAVVTLIEQMFGSSEEYVFPGPDATVRDVVTKYADMVFDDLGDKPEIELRLRSTLGLAFYNLSDFVRSEQNFARMAELCRRLLGPQAPRVSEALNQMGAARLALGNYAGAEQAYLEALAIDQTLRGDPQCIEADTLFNLGVAVEALGRAADAESYYRRAIERFQQAPPERRQGLFAARKHLAGVLQNTGKWEESESLLREALSMALEQFGDDETRTASVKGSLACLLQRTGRSDEAIRLFQEAIASERSFAGGGPRLATHLTNLGVTYLQLGRLAESEPLLDEALALQRAVLPEDHPDIAESRSALGALFEARQQYEQAAQHRRAALDMLLTHFDPAHPKVVRTRGDLARTFYLLGRYDDAAALFEQALEILHARSAEGPELADAMQLLGIARIKQGRFAEAEELLRPALEAAEHAAITWKTHHVRSLMGDALLGLGRLDEAEALLAPAADALRDMAGAPKARVRDALDRLARLCEARGDAARATALRAELAQSK